MNEENVRKLFEELLTDLESATQVREWDNAASGNQFHLNNRIAKKKMENYRKRLDAALAPAPQE